MLRRNLSQASCGPRPLGSTSILQHVDTCQCGHQVPTIVRLSTLFSERLGVASHICLQTHFLGPALSDLPSHWHLSHLPISHLPLHTCPLKSALLTPAPLRATPPPSLHLPPHIYLFTPVPLAPVASGLHPQICSPHTCPFRSTSSDLPLHICSPWP